MNLPVWIGVGVALLLLMLGFAGLAVGAFLVVQQLRRRQVNQQHRAKKIAELRQLPHRPTMIVPSSQRPTIPVRDGATALDAGPPSTRPTLAPEEEVDVPTAVFRASQYADIEALMKDANKYVDDHNSTKGRGKR